MDQGLGVGETLSVGGSTQQVSVCVANKLVSRVKVCAHLVQKIIVVAGGKKTGCAKRRGGRERVQINRVVCAKCQGPVHDTHLTLHR